MEAAIATLNVVAAEQDKVARIFVMFSQGISATATLPEDVGNWALDLGIPIYPVALNYLWRHDKCPRNLFQDAPVHGTRQDDRRPAVAIRIA
jgi:hypothetical protein